MALTVDFKLWIVFDADGQCEADADRDIAIERFNDNVGSEVTRIVCLALHADAPKDAVVNVDIAAAHEGVAAKSED
jgi:hypothetical protein